MRRIGIRNEMLWLGLIIGLVVGASFGVVIAGMLFSAKAGDKALSEIERSDRLDSISGNNNKNKQEAYNPTQKSKKSKKNPRIERYHDLTR